jgi:hypothetical protein
MAKKKKKENKKSPQELKFSVSGVVYQFEKPKMKVKLPGQDYRVLTAEEALQETDVLVHLVERKSGIISVDEKATEIVAEKAKEEAAEKAAAKQSETAKKASGKDEKSQPEESVNAKKGGEDGSE